MRIVLIGGGGIGYALAEALSLQHDIFVIDSNPGRADRFAQLDIEFVHGSGTNPAVLRRAATDRADLLIAATGLDEVNIVACSIATQLGKCETICFVGKEDLLQTSGGSDSLRKHFGIGRVVWPEAMKGAHSISGRTACSGSAACGTAPAPACMRGGRRRRPLAGAGRSAPPRTTSWSAILAACSRRRRFMAKGTGKPGRSFGSRESARPRSGCAG